MAMDPEKKAKWVEDLRSGNFEKGKSRLHGVTKNADGTETHRFCCLGVLAEQAVAAGACERRDDDASAVTYYDAKNTRDSDFSLLPSVVMQWAGLESRSPDVLVRGHLTTLAFINDNDDATFAEIADMIEADANI